MIKVITNSSGFVKTKLFNSIQFCIVTLNNMTPLNSIASGLINKATWNRFGMHKAYEITDLIVTVFTRFIIQFNQFNYVLLF
jgi:hypothetical protein